MRNPIAEASLRAACTARGLSLAAIEVHDTLPSTNTYLRTCAPLPAHATLVVADAQSAGKGSRGRKFLSPVGGLYASIFLRETPNPMHLTAAAAVAVHRALLTCLGAHTQIKWVNDLYLAGRKVCGILAEGVTVGSTLAGVILGIGINLSVPPGGFPPELAEIAGAVSDTSLTDNTRHALLAELLRELFACLADPAADYMETYRKENLVRGRTARYLRGGTETPAEVLDIAEDGALRLRLSDGTTVLAHSGELLLNSNVQPHE